MKSIIVKILAVVMVLCLAIGTLAGCKPNPCESGHKWSNGELTQAVTASVDGEITYTCLTCKEKKTESVAKGTSITTRKDLEEAIVATAWAYTLKKGNSQYDSRQLTYVTDNYGGISRHSKDATPEFGTSDTILYTVCSAYVANAYREGIGRYLFEDKYHVRGVFTDHFWLVAENQPEEGYYPTSTDAQPSPVGENDYDMSILRWVNYDAYKIAEGTNTLFKAAKNTGVFNSSSYTDWYTDGKLEFKYDSSADKYTYYLNGSAIPANQVVQLVKNFINKQVDGEYVNLRVGDILNNNGHAVLYIGNGRVLESCGDKYDIETGTDNVEYTGTSYGNFNKADGTIATSHYFYNIIRPSDMYAQDFDGNMDNDIVKYEGEMITIPDDTKTRLENPCMEIDRTVSASPYGSVAKNENLAYNVKITNFTNDKYYKAWLNKGNDCQVEYKNLKVTEKIPANTEFVSATGDYTLENGVITWVVNIPAGEMVDLTYTVKAIGEVGTFVVSDGGFVGNIPSNSIKYLVGNGKLNATQTALLTALGELEDTSSLYDTYGADTAFANNLYSAMGVNLNLPSVENLIENLFKPTLFNGFKSTGNFYADSTMSKTVFVPQKEVSAEYLPYKNMIVNGYIGGYRMFPYDYEKLAQVGVNGMNYHTEYNTTIMDFRLNYLEVGDIIVYATASDRGETTLSSSVSYTNVLIYLGDNTILGMESNSDGTHTATIYKDEVAENILIKAYWKEHDIFFALRTSQVMELN